MTATMKNIVILMSSVLLVSCVTADMGNTMGFGKHHEAFAKCMDEFDVEPANIRNVLKGATDETRRTRNCFVACILDHEGILKDGQYNRDALCDEIKERLPEDLATIGCEHSNKCVDEVEGIDDKCDAVEKYHGCFYENLPKELQDYRDAMHAHHSGPMRRLQH